MVAALGSIVSCCHVVMWFTVFCSTPSVSYSATQQGELYATNFHRESLLSTAGLRAPRWTKPMMERMQIPAGWLEQLKREPKAKPEEEWLGHWELESSENDKAEQAMKREGVPYLVRSGPALALAHRAPTTSVQSSPHAQVHVLCDCRSAHLLLLSPLAQARKIALRFKSERRFKSDEEHGGQLVGEIKTVTGKWTEMSTTHPTLSKAGGFAAKSVTSWEADGVLRTVSTVTGPMGGSSKVTTTRHYLDGDRLVSETITPGGSYKAYFRKRTQREEPVRS